MLSPPPARQRLPIDFPPPQIGDEGLPLFTTLS